MPFFSETGRSENCWCSWLRVKSLAFESSWLIPDLNLFPSLYQWWHLLSRNKKKPKGCKLNAWQKWSLTAIMTLAVLPAAPRLCSTCRTGILPKWSRHRMSRELYMCSFWKRRLTFCFLKSCGLTRLVCFGLCLLILALCRHLANTAPGSSAWRPCVCHLVSGLGYSFPKDDIETNT